tara:strand:+ start:511 stop:840 length:330 start_codon:yes stop_codon:yes gene_type:complete
MKLYSEDLFEYGDGSIEIDFEPNKYKTKASAAKGLHKALSKLAEDIGQSSREVMLHNPEQAERYGYSKNWVVCWETGFYQWATQSDVSNYDAGWYTEPHYSFDLTFVDA